MKRRSEGAISVFLIVIIVAIFALGGALIDITRLVSAQSLLTTAQNAALDSSLTYYSKPLQENYGIFAFQKNQTIDDNFKMHLTASMGSGSSQGLYGFDIKTIELSPKLALSDYLVLRRQILEYSKYRHSITIVEKVMERFKAIYQVMTSAKHFGNYVDIKHVEVELVERDLEIQECLLHIESQKEKPIGFDEAVSLFQDRYAVIDQQINDLQLELEALSEELDQVISDLDGVDSTIEVTNSDGTITTKPNPDYARLKRKLTSIKEKIASKKDEVKSLKKEQEDLVDAVMALIPFYENLKRMNEELVEHGEWMKEALPKFLQAIEENDQRLLEDQIEQEDPGRALHDEYQALLEKYDGEQIERLIGCATQNVACVNQVLVLIHEGVDSPPPSVHFKEQINDAISQYTVDFGYESHAVDLRFDTVLDKTEYKRFTRLFKELMEAFEERVERISDGIAGNNDDELKPYENYKALPSYVYGNAADYKGDPIYNREHFKTKSGILGTDVDDGSGGLDIFRALGESGTGSVNDSVMDAFLTNSVLQYEEALINEYIFEHFNGASINMRVNDQALWAEGEVEYILFGREHPRQNIRYAEATLFTIRLLPNSMSYFIFKKKEMDAIASACTAPFPPLYPVLSVAIPMLAGTVESLADVKLLKGGEDLPVFKLKEDLLFSFDFKSLRDVNDFLEALIILVGDKKEFSSLSDKSKVPDGEGGTADGDGDDVDTDNKQKLVEITVKFNYEDYMRVLLFTMGFTEEGRQIKLYRIADLIHMNTEQTTAGFDMGSYYTRLYSQVGMDMDLWFITNGLYRCVRWLSKKQLIELELERGY